MVISRDHPGEERKKQGSGEMGKRCPSGSPSRLGRTNQTGRHVLCRPQRQCFAERSLQRPRSYNSQVGERCVTPACRCQSFVAQRKYHLGRIDNSCSTCLPFLVSITYCKA